MSVERAIILLEQIRDFGHVEDCLSCAPVYECGCYDKDQSELAEEALRELDEDDQDRMHRSEYL